MKQYCLSNSNIDFVCEEIEDFLTDAGVERRKVLRAKLTFEELLLEYQAKFGTDGIFEVICTKRFSSAKVEIIVLGESFNPLSQECEEIDLAQSILANIGLAPTWNYKKDRNYIVFISKKKPLSATLKIAIAIMLSLIAGFIISLLPENITSGINEYALTPIAYTFLGLISAVSGPLIFLSVLGSICSMGNMETLGKIGGKTLKAILIHILIIGIAMTTIGSLFFHVEWKGGGEATFSQVINLLYDIIPSNLFEPFISGNALQLIFIAIILGLAMLVLSTRVSGVFNLVEQLSGIIQTVMMGVSSTLPILIFVLFARMISSGNLGIMLSSLKISSIIILLDVGYYVLNILRVALTKRISPILLFKKAWPTFAICLTTASSAAAFTTNISDSHKKFGIDKRLVEFATPVGQVLFMPGMISLLFGLGAGLAEIYGITITVPWLIYGLVMSILLSFSSPPVPGGATMCFTITFTQLGIPLESIGIALAVAAIVDFISTACNVSSWQLNLIDVADSLGMLNKEVLRNQMLKTK